MLRILLLTITVSILLLGNLHLEAADSAEWRGIKFMPKATAVFKIGDEVLVKIRVEIESCTETFAKASLPAFQTLRVQQRIGVI